MGDLDRLYDLLSELKDRLGGYRRLKDCTARDGWPQRGVYFFFEDGEAREEGSPRVVRVGTHALRTGSKTSLWDRLRQHRGSLRGTFAGGGAHRSSIFRLHAGTALLNRDHRFSGDISESWGRGGSASRQVRQVEHRLEIAVSQYIGRMPFLWLAVPDPAGPGSDRGRIEANVIALLGMCGRRSIDPPSATWLGRDAASQAVRDSGLWNVNHVDGHHDPAVLDLLEAYVRAP